jgi:rhodanese-related sulfurtransferase
MFGTDRDKLLRLICTAAVIVAVSALSAFALNAIRAESLPLIRPAAVPVEEGGDPSALSLAKAKQLYDEGVLFIDARSRQEFDQGHIEGAVLLYYAHADAEWETALSGHEDLDAPLVVYCSGEGCNSSEIVADLLRKVGYSKVYLFHGGWPAWLAAGYPRAGEPQAPKLYEFQQ